MDAKAWDERYAAAGPDLVWTAEANVFVRAETEDLEPGRALDVAAGEGRNAVWLAERGWEVTAVDFSAVALDKGRQLAEHRQVTGRIEWVCADLLTWAPPPESYGLAVVAYLHLLPDELAGVLRRVAAAVRPGGRLLVVGHDRTNLEHGVGGPQDPAVLYTPSAISDALDTHAEAVQATTVQRPTTAGTALDTLWVGVRR